MIAPDPACQSRAERIRRSFLSFYKPERSVYRGILQQSSYWSELIQQERVQVLFWSFFGSRYDSDIGRFQGHRTSPAPPSPSRAHDLRCLRRREFLSALENVRPLSAND